MSIFKKGLTLIQDYLEKQAFKKNEESAQNIPIPIDEVITIIENSDNITTIESSPTETTIGSEIKPEIIVQPELPFDLKKVIWLHPNVSEWKITSKLDAKLKGDKINLNYDKSKIWKPVLSTNKKLLVGNPWIFIKIINDIYAATWEWLGQGQTSKSKSAVSGTHIKKNPLMNWTPIKGNTYWFMVSGLCRDVKRNNKERTIIVPLKWE